MPIYFLNKGDDSAKMFEVYGWVNKIAKTTFNLKQFDTVKCLVSKDPSSPQYLPVNGVFPIAQGFNGTVSVFELELGYKSHYLHEWIMDRWHLRELAGIKKTVYKPGNPVPDYFYYPCGTCNYYLEDFRKMNISGPEGYFLLIMSPKASSHLPVRTSNLIKFVKIINDKMGTDISNIDIFITDKPSFPDTQNRRDLLEEIKQKVWPNHYQ